VLKSQEADRDQEFIYVAARIVEETPAYWRVLFDNPPLNVVDTNAPDRDLFLTSDMRQAIRGIQRRLLLRQSNQRQFDVGNRGIRLKGNRSP
jgi:hypothetical protein